jgi:hypothetical protein
MIEQSPFILNERQFGSLVDKDPKWRNAEVFARDEAPCRAGRWAGAPVSSVGEADAEHAGVAGTFHGVGRAHVPSHRPDTPQG